MNSIAGLKELLQKEKDKVKNKCDELEQLQKMNHRLSRENDRLKRNAEDSEAKDDMLSLLRTPKWAKNEYVEQKPAKYVFKCKDGDIQIPEYGLLRTEFYNQGGIIPRAGYMF